MKHVLIDGFCFQSGDEAASSAVISAIPKLRAAGIAVTFLDRGKASAVSCNRILPFPAWTGVASATDSFLVQKFCDQFSIDVVLTTGVASAVRTPSVMLTSGFFTGDIHPARHARLMTERELAILHAREVICLSAVAERDVIAARCIAAEETEGEELLTNTDMNIQLDPSLRLIQALASAASAQSSRVYRDFARDWLALRAIQAAVDLEVYADA